MFKELKKINSPPAPFECYTADDLWTNEHTSKQMLKYHLHETIDAASRNRIFIENSVEWIVSHFNVHKNTKIIDFGCGPGLYTNKLAEHNAIVTGIDFSQNSLNYAKQTAAEKDLNVNYIFSNYLNFETENRYDLITMIMCDFCAISPEQRKILLSKFSSLLKPNGSVLLDAYTLNSFNNKSESASYELNQLNGFWSKENYYCFINTFKYENEKVTLDKYTIFEESQKRVVYNWLQYYSIDSLKNEFKENGLKIEKIYSDVAGKAFAPEALEIAVVAKKI